MKHANIVALSGSNAASITSAPIDAIELYRASFQSHMADATGAGTIAIQVSNDIYNAQYLPNAFTPTNWTTIFTNTYNAASSPTLSDPLELSYRWLRVVFTSTTPGTSTIAVNMFALSY